MPILPLFQSAPQRAGSPDARRQGVALQVSDSATSRVANDLLASVDHLVYVTADLEKGIAEIEKSLGVQALAGGQHPGRGTRNAIVALSCSSYLEIIGPDPAQPGTRVARWFGIDTLAWPRLFTWAVKSANLKDLVTTAARSGVRLGPVVLGSRKRSDGVDLQWQFTDPAAVVGDGLVPFFIDWGNSPHPAMSAPGGPELVSLHGQHEEPATIRRQLAAVGIDLPVERGPRPTLIATLRTPSGTVLNGVKLPPKNAVGSDAFQQIRRAPRRIILTPRKAAETCRSPQRQAATNTYKRMTLQVTPNHAPAVEVLPKSDDAIRTNNAAGAGLTAFASRLVSVFAWPVRLLA